MKHVKNYKYIYIAIVLAILLFTPYLLVNCTWGYSLESESAYTIGGAVGGLTAPIIGIITVLVTFLAFYIQLKANETQIEANRQVEKDMKIGRIETQFYQMLELHRQNIQDFRFISNNPQKQIKGRQAFEMLLKCVNDYFNERAEGTVKDRMFWAYDNVFNGIGDSKISKCGAHAVEIAHYIRQLYHTVKYITNNDNIENEHKHNYLRQLRAQMSTDEQILLFYNWYSDKGSQWEDDNNSFLTEYRMIHNIFPDRMPKDLKKELLGEKISKVKPGKNSLSKSIFEFQDWGDYWEENR